MRAFVALMLEPDDARALHAWSVRALERVPGARRIRAEELHVTLVFCDDVDEARGDELVREARDVEPAFAGAAFSPSRVVRFGGAIAVLLDPADADATGRLVAAQEGLAARLVALGLAPDDRSGRWTPHVTVARTRDPKARVDAVQAPAGPLRVAGVVAYRSTQTPEGARYSPLPRPPA